MIQYDTLSRKCVYWHILKLKFLCFNKNTSYWKFASFSVYYLPIGNKNEAGIAIWHKSVQSNILYNTCTS